MDVELLLKKHYPADGIALQIVLEHSRMVANKALAIARSALTGNLDLEFIREAALLHDIGVCRTLNPTIGCYGTAPYITHGIIGRQILEAEGLPRHALVCERHIGVGLTSEDILQQGLPLPDRDMSPQTMEERIVCVADLFYSKRPGRVTEEKSLHSVKRSLQRFGDHKVHILERWLLDLGITTVG